MHLDHLHGQLPVFFVAFCFPLPIWTLGISSLPVWRHAATTTCASWLWRFQIGIQDPWVTVDDDSRDLEYCQLTAQFGLLTFHVADGWICYWSCDGESCQVRESEEGGDDLHD